MQLRHGICWLVLVVALQLIMGCGRQGDARQRVPVHAAERPPAGTQQHAHAGTTTSDKTPTPGTATRVLSPIERLAQRPARRGTCPPPRRKRQGSTAPPVLMRAHRTIPAHKAIP